SGDRVAADRRRLGGGARRVRPVGRFPPADGASRRCGGGVRFGMTGGEGREVILREDVPHLGTIGDIVKVRAGYARNYLLPRGLATVADKRNLRALEHERRLVDETRKRALGPAEPFPKQLTAAHIIINPRAGE